MSADLESRPDERLCKAALEFARELKGMKQMSMRGSEQLSLCIDWVTEARDELLRAARTYVALQPRQDAPCSKRPARAKKAPAANRTRDGIELDRELDGRCMWWRFH